MAIASPITPACLPEASDYLVPSRIMGCFSQLLVMLSALVEAERDLEHFDVWDIATAHWLREAEEAFTRVTTQISMIRMAHPKLPGDRQLQRVTELIDRMIGSEEPGTFGRMYCRLHRAEALFLHPGDGPVAHRVAELLAGARARIDDLASLSTFIDPLAPDGAAMAEAAPVIGAAAA